MQDNIDYSLIFNEDIPTKRACLKRLIDAAFYIIAKHMPDDRKSQSDHEAFILFQMISLRSVAVLQLSDEYKLKNGINGNTLQIPDPFSVYSLVRTLFEGYCNFNSIYVQSKSSDEIALKHQLWVLSGLKSRQQFPTTIEEHQIKKQSEQKIIALLMQSIQSNPIFLQLASDSQKKILKAIERKKWHIIIDGKEAHIAHWQELFKCVMTDPIFDVLYTSLSLNTHPSNASVFQFAQLYVLNQEEHSLRTALKISHIILSFFIVDYCQYFKNLSSIYSELPPDSIFLIDAYNKMRTSPA